jgi:hypothetical protein
MRSFILLIIVACLITTAHAQWTTNGANIYFNSGNVGIGTGNPGAKISFTEVNTHSNAEGLTWYSPDPTGYGIFRTAGSWSSPDYQQLKLRWATGITLDPGANYGKSYVDIQGGGLRVTSGNVGIGTISPVAKVHVEGSVYSNASRSDAVFNGNPQVGHPNFVGSDGTWAFRTSMNYALNVDVYNSGGSPIAAMSILQNGRIGVGTPSPDHIFQVHGSNVPSIAIGKASTNTSGKSSLWFFAGDASAQNGFAVNYHKTSSTDRLAFVDGGAVEVLSLVNGGRVGIGTTSPTYKLDVVGGAIALDADQPLRGGGRWLISGNSSAVTVGTANPGIGIRLMAGADDPRIFIDGATGDVGIGSLTPDAKLSVKGQIHAQEVKVDLNGSVAPDYVFEKVYKLPSLEEIKSYIEVNKHLPEVPSAKEMEANGINLGEMNLILLKKIEELTLHLIEMKEMNAALEARVKTLESK